jgi:hypothetical protein
MKYYKIIILHTTLYRLLRRRPMTSSPGNTSKMKVMKIEYYYFLISSLLYFFTFLQSLYTKTLSFSYFFITLSFHTFILIDSDRRLWYSLVEELPHTLLTIFYKIIIITMRSYILSSAYYK